MSAYSARNYFIFHSAIYYVQDMSFFDEHKTGEIISRYFPPTPDDYLPIAIALFQIIW